VRLSFIQRIAPPLQGWPELKHWGRASNAAVTVSDMAASRRFFGDILGMAKGSATNTVGGDGPNVMGLPWDYARRAPVDIQGWSGGGGGDGSIELISMPGLLGRSHASRAHPPNFGIAALRIFSADALALAGRLKAAGAVVTPVIDDRVPPLGPCRVFAVTGPDAVRLEVVQPLA
jgi:catechol 2,3-dioxygenase-like lactoylglutathione lyase family enzyme